MTIVLLAFVAGLATIVNPCVLPLVPMVFLGASARSRFGPLALAAGLALTFGLVGGTLASLGVEFGESPALRIPTALLLIVIGLILAVQRLSDMVARAIQPLVNSGSQLSVHVSDFGLGGQFLIGALLALIWAPCIGPTMGAVIVLAASGGTRAIAFIAMTAFAIGAAISLLLIGFLLKRLTLSSKSVALKAGHWMKVATGIVLILVGLGSLTGLDHVVESGLLDLMPDWFLRLASRL